VALAGMPEHSLPRPPGIADLRINPQTGLIAADCRRDFEWEMFLEENQPERELETNCQMASPLSPATDAGQNPDAGSNAGPSIDDLFE
jgi:membrane carboxypeptidase/penicillin-binding protein